MGFFHYNLKGIMKFLVSLLFVPIVCFAQKNDCKYINPDKVKWSDFKGKADYNKKKTDALTATSYQFSIASDSMRTHFVKAEIGILFCSGSSWVKSSKIADKKLWARLLDHERLHIKLQMVNAKKFKKKLLDLRNVDQTNLNALISNFTSTDQQQAALYDSETNHGRSEKAQHKWKEKIENDLKDLENIKLIGE
jgi:hypothetical protein